MAEYITFQPSDYFNTKLYNGTAGTQTISGVGFQPDSTWLKARSESADWGWFDASRGATKDLSQNNTNAESTLSDSLTSWNSDGFVMGSGADFNANSQTYASYNWKANGAGAANSDGSITTTKTSANTTSGVSVVTYTGTGAAATIGHGLGAVPKMMIAKRLDTVNSWMVYHEAIGNAKELYLNANSTESAAANSWNSTTPTSSVWSVATDANNTSGGTFVTYLFAEKKGFSKFGKYKGNNNSNGLFVYTGFRPAWIMCKRISSTGDWFVFDNKQSPCNVFTYYLRPNQSGAGASDVDFGDFTSNGFKWRTTDGGGNGNHTYVYAAFAEFPLVASNSIPGLAR